MPISKADLSKAMGLALLSAAALVFEISLTRLFAIQQFYHFAFVVVSLAVMGFAASGLLLTLRSQPPRLSWLSIGFSFTVILSYLTLNFLPFDSYSITSDPKQVWILLLYFAAAGLPFLFAGWTTGASLMAASTGVHLPYAANLIGSALGCPLALGAISLLGGERTILLSVVMGLLAGIFFVQKPREAIYLLLTIIILCTGFIAYPHQLNLQLSPYKPLSLAQLAPDARHTLTLWSTSSRLDVVETDTIHVYPGLSLNASFLPPHQIACFIDGDGPIPITHLALEEPEAGTLAEYMPSALAYMLRPEGKILILQPGGGLEAIIALASSATEVTLTCDEPLIFEILQGPYRQFSQDLLFQSKVILSDRSARGTLEASQEKYDIIVFALSDSYRPITSGAFSLTENYLLTVETLMQAYNSLEEEGLLVITRWLGTPPSESARAWATLLAALDSLKVENPSSHLIAYRGMRTATMIAARRPFTADELAGVRRFLETNAFDPIYLPDLHPEELNRFNKLPDDVYYELYGDLVEDYKSASSTYAFDISPATDDHPFFFHFFRWRQTPEVLAALGKVWQPFGGSGYLVLIALLALMLIFAIPVGTAPLILIRRGRGLPVLGKRTPLYFACLGAGYLLIEISLIQKYTLLLDRPSIALAVVLFSMLLFSGLGSLCSRRIPLRPVLGGLVLYLVALNLTLPLLIRISLSWNEIPRFLLTMFLLAPAGFLMGIPFATGLRVMEKRTPGLIPWAWAINGAVSGVAGVIAALVSLEWGLSITLGLGTLTYLGALLASPIGTLQEAYRHPSTDHPKSA